MKIQFLKLGNVVANSRQKHQIVEAFTLTRVQIAGEYTRRLIHSGRRPFVWFGEGENLRKKFVFKLNS
jgi:hypothetical protein